MRMRFLVGMVLAMLSASTFAAASIISANHFSDINELIANDKHPENTLLVMDDDDTLTMMPCKNKHHCQYLGGPAWYQWQSNLPTNSADRVSSTLTGLIHISNVIFLLTHMPLVEPDIADTLKMAQNAGVHLLVATARGENQSAATLNQLSYDGVLKTISAASIPSVTGTYIPKDGTRAISYRDGVLFLAGQNKGTMIQDFLKKAGYSKKITRIIFIDDTYQNVQNVADAYTHQHGISVTAIHYTNLATHKADFLTGSRSKKLQERAKKRWHRIQKTLKNNLPGLYLG